MNEMGARIGPNLSTYAKSMIGNPGDLPPMQQVSILMHLLYEIEDEWAQMQKAAGRRTKRLASARASRGD